jgi:hypothetical protein
MHQGPVGIAVERGLRYARHDQRVSQAENHSEREQGPDGGRVLPHDGHGEIATLQHDRHGAT